MSPIRQTLRTMTLVAALVAVPAVTTAAPAAAATPTTTCPAVNWGSLPKISDRWPDGGFVTNVRTGQHACYDRIVLDVSGPGSVGYEVSYVPEITDFSNGGPAPMAGGAFILIDAGAPAYDPDTGRFTYNPTDPFHLVNVLGYRTFRQVASAGTFDGKTAIGLGVRAKLPMRVFVLSGPGDNKRLVVDVYHKWTSFSA